MIPQLTIIAVIGIVMTVACRSSGTAPIPRLNLTGTWVTTDASRDELRVTLTQSGEAIAGTGTLMRMQPVADTATLAVFGVNLGDLQCLTVCAPIALTIADTQTDTLFVTGQAGDKTHFSGMTLGSKVPGRFAALIKTTLVFSAQ